MRPHRAHQLAGLCARQPCAARALPRSFASLHIDPQQPQIRRRHDTSFPPDSHFAFKQSRFKAYAEPPGVIPEVRNPLNYVDLDRRQHRVRQTARRRMMINGIGLLFTIGFQIWLVTTFWEPAKADKGDNDSSSSTISAPSMGKERLDASPNAGISEEDAKRGVRVVQKPGQPDIKLDEQGLELVETGTSYIPYFPRFIKVSSSTADPAATPTSDVPGIGAEEGLEEYSLLGLGIRRVSFLGVQVYVLGLYVRTVDLDKLQAAFVRHVNPLGSSLIPSEKETLRKDLMDADNSLDIWNKVLQEVGVRSAVRIVPTRSTDFAHLRDGWVRGITGRTQELAKKGSKEYEDDAFGEAMQEFKSLMGGKGKTPKGSTLLLTRDEKGVLSVMFEPEKKTKEGEFIVERTTNQPIGRMTDERISRQVWLGYLGGKNVSSEDAKKNIVDGVMELVERPVGTVGSQVM